MYDDSDSVDNAPVYNRGDIVWVKLSGCWWPGEVKNIEDVPEELVSQFRKPPLVIVKFFDEDSYEYVKNWSHIYPYNCEKKNDFIKKGMVGFRSKSSHMSKFPTDIGTAEEKTNGNPNILSLPEFLPVKKINYHEIFGSPVTKKSKLSSIKKNIGKDALQPLITHRRFLGKDDYKAFICLQYPGKYILCDSDEEEIKKLNREPTKDLNCRFCAFKTKRLEVMILHAKTHMKGSVTTSVKRKSIKSKEVVMTDTDSESEAIKSSKPKQRRRKEFKPKKQNSFSYLLDEWDETDEEECNKKSSKNKDESMLKDDEENDSKENSKNADNSIGSPLNKNTHEDIKNCFDFDEEDEDEEITFPSSAGRKIPRVIPEKLKTAPISELIEEESEKNSSDKAEKSDELTKEEMVQSCEVDVKPSESDETIDDKAFNELMQETSVPKLDDITQTLKPEQNFHDATTIKYPDKGGTASKGGTSSRKCITSFEEFETGFQQQHLEPRSSVNDEITDTSKESDEKLELSKESEKRKKQIKSKSTDISPKSLEATTIDDVPNTLTESESDGKKKSEQEKPNIQGDVRKSNGGKKPSTRKLQRFTIGDSEHTLSFGQVLQQSEENTVETTRRGRSKKLNENATEATSNSDNTNLISREADESITLSDNRDAKTDTPRSKRGKHKTGLPEKKNEVSDRQSKKPTPNEEINTAGRDHVETNGSRGRRSKNRKRESQTIADKEVSSEVSTEKPTESNNLEVSNNETGKLTEYEGPVTAELSYEIDQPRTPIKPRRKNNQKGKAPDEAKSSNLEKPPKTSEELQSDTKNNAELEKNHVTMSIEPHVSDTKEQNESNTDQQTEENKLSTSHKTRRRKRSLPPGKLSNDLHTEPSTTSKKDAENESEIKTNEADNKSVVNIPTPEKSMESREADTVKSELIPNDVEQLGRKDTNTQPVKEKRSKLKKTSRGENILGHNNLVENITEIGGTDSEKCVSPSRRSKRNQHCNQDTSDNTTVVKPIDESQLNSDQNTLEPTVEDHSVKEEIDVSLNSRGKRKRTRKNSKATTEKDISDDVTHSIVANKDSEINIATQETTNPKDLSNQVNDEDVFENIVNNERSKLELISTETIDSSSSNSIIQDEKNSVALKQEGPENVQTNAPNEDRNTPPNNYLQDNILEESSYSKDPTDATEENNQDIRDDNCQSETENLCKPVTTDDLIPSNVDGKLDESKLSKINEESGKNQDVQVETTQKNQIGDEVDLLTQTLEGGGEKMTELLEEEIKNNDTSVLENIKDDNKPSSVDENEPVDDLKELTPDNKEMEDLPQIVPDVKIIDEKKRPEDKNMEEAELILPLKKSKRANDISHFIGLQRDNTNSALDDNSADTEIQDSSNLDQLDAGDIFKCVPPKKKKIESLIDQPSLVDKSEEIPQPPKKKMQKLFESSQALEKSHEMPLMSPLAKKKNFLFQQEDYEQDLDMKNIDNAKSNDLTKVDSLVPKNLEILSKESDDKKSEKLSNDVALDESEQNGSQVDFDKQLTNSESDLKIEQPAKCSLTTSEIWDVIGISDNTDGSTPEALNTEVDSKSLDTSADNQENNQKLVTKDENSKPLEETEPKTEELSKSVISSEKVEEESLKSLEKDCEIQSILEPTIPADIPFLSESELVPIEGTLTVMSEKDLADAQVEITPDKVISEKKPMTLETFSMDFTDINFDSTSKTKIAKEKKVPKVPESTAKASSNLDSHPAVTQSNMSTYKSELLDILEGNSNSSGSDSKPVFDDYEKKSNVTDMFDFEDAIPSQIVLSNKIQSDSPKLLERLSMSTDSSKKIIIQSDMKFNENISKTIINKPKFSPVPKPGRKIIIKTSKTGGALTKSSSGGKPIILSEQIIRPANPAISGKDQSQGVKRQFEDVEDVETAFIIPKVAKKSVEEEVIALTPDKAQKMKTVSKPNIRPKIIQQTIITSKGEIIQPQTTTTTITTQSTPLQTDETVFDINSMPIVISDDLLTPESIQNMPVVLSEEVQKSEKTTGTIVKKAVSNVSSKQQIVFKTTQATTGTTVIGKQVKPRILSSTSPTTKINKPGSTLLATIDGKPTKYVLVPSSLSATLPSGKALKTVIKKTVIPSKQQPVPQTSELSNQSIGNKIMIATNQHGQQHRVVLTPQQQKLLMQAQTGGPKATKTVIKSGIPKNILESTCAGPSGITPKTTLVTQHIISSSSVMPNTSGLLMPVTKTVKTPTQCKKVSPKIGGKPQKTILIKNQLGQTVRRIQGTDDAELDRQVAEQLEAIKARAKQQQATKSQDTINFASRQISANKISGARRQFIKKPEVLMKSKTTLKPSDSTVPALAPISPQPKVSHGHLNLTKSSIVTEKPTDTLLQVSVANQSDTKVTKPDNKPDRPLNKLVIQDALGNQTTITEGQILALPSETVDGQPQSYMLVTLDETGNLTPLNNEALMSLDPSLGVGGDINNVVLQVDQGQGIMAAVKQTEMPVNEKKIQIDDRLKTEPKIIQENVPKISSEQSKVPELPVGIGGDDTASLTSDLPSGGQQLIVTGDPIATQKFLESLSDGTTDLANILANAEGGSVIIQADGQQILIKTNSSDAQNTIGLGENPEGAGNPVFSSHKPNQDILAAALADTDVFQQADQSPICNSSVKGQLSPGSGASLYPMHVGNVLETSLTLSSPIMTPLEVPSINSKKIDDQADILNQVPKNVDLPITITDPNISQTVAHQSAPGLMELTLPLTDTTSSSDMNSPSSYAYTLPPVEEAVQNTQKPFSMPLLLTDDDTEVEDSRSIKKKESLIEKDMVDEHSTFDSLHLMGDAIETTKEHDQKSDAFGDINSLPILTEDVVEDSTSSIDSTKVTRSSPKDKDHDIVNEGLCTLGGEMCSSLSEPPPDMFDLGPMTNKEDELSSDISSVPEGTAMSPNSEASGEIPLQPQIVATLNDLKRPSAETENEQEMKRQKFD